MFGLSFGAKKRSGSTDITKNEVGTQSQSGATATSGTSSTSTAGTQTNNTTGQSTTSNNSATNTTGQTSSQQTGSSQTLSSDVLSGLDSGITRLIGQVFDPNSGDRAQLARGMSMMGDFDVDSFVEGTLRSAMQQEGTQLGAAVRGLFNMIGGSGEENSMSALLGNQMKMDAEDRLAGRAAEAHRVGEGIVNERASGIVQGATAGTQALQALVEAVKGGQTTATGTTQEQSQQGQTGNVNGTTNTAEQSQQASNQVSNTVQSVVELVQQLLNSNVSTTGTERTKGKEMGGGFSLSI